MSDDPSPRSNDKCILFHLPWPVSSTCVLRIAFALIALAIVCIIIPIVVDPGSYTMSLVMYLTCGPLIFIFVFFALHFFTFIRLVAVGDDGDLRLRTRCCECMLWYLKKTGWIIKPFPRRDQQSISLSERQKSSVSSPSSSSPEQGPPRRKAGTPSVATSHRVTDRRMSPSELEKYRVSGGRMSPSEMEQYAEYRPLQIRSPRSDESTFASVTLSLELFKESSGDSETGNRPEVYAASVSAYQSSRPAVMMETGSMSSGEVFQPGDVRTRSPKDSHTSKVASSADTSQRSRSAPSKSFAVSFGSREGKVEPRWPKMFQRSKTTSSSEDDPQSRSGSAKTSVSSRPSEEVSSCGDESENQPLSSEREPRSDKLEAASELSASHSGLTEPSIEMCETSRREEGGPLSPEVLHKSSLPTEGDPEHSKDESTSGSSKLSKETEC